MKAIIATLKEAQRTLEDGACEIVVGVEGPTLDEMVSMVETAGRCYGENSSDHTSQWVWRKIQEAIEMLESK